MVPNILFHQVFGENLCLRQHPPPLLEYPAPVTDIVWYCVLIGDVLFKMFNEGCILPKFVIYNFVTCLPVVKPYLLDIEF